MPAKLADVARLAGVSIATVSRVLADKPHVSASVRTRVLAAAAELNYRPSRVARSLRAQRARVIGLLLADIRERLFTAFVRAVEDVAYTHRYSFLLCNTDEDPDKIEVYVDLMAEEHVAGVILVPTPGAERAYQRLVEAQIPVVAIERRLPKIAQDAVMLEHAEATRAVVARLIDAGHRRIGAVLAHGEGSAAHTRRRGYLQALADHDIPAAPEWVRAGPATVAFGREAAEVLLDQCPRLTALYVAAYLPALGVLQAVTARRLRIPEDVAVAAVDAPDCSDAIHPLLAEANAPEHQAPAYAAGEIAANLLLARIADRDRPPQRVVVGAVSQPILHPNAA
jgi:DNA-binding LacI/PurR family transcriptional regulator